MWKKKKASTVLTSLLIPLTPISSKLFTLIALSKINWIKKPRHYPSWKKLFRNYLLNRQLIRAWVCMSSSRDWNHVFLIKFINLFQVTTKSESYCSNVWDGILFFGSIDNEVEFLISIYANYVNENLSQSQKNVREFT